MWGFFYHILLSTPNQGVGPLDMLSSRWSGIAVAVATSSIKEVIFLRARHRHTSFSNRYWTWPRRLGGNGADGDRLGAGAVVQALIPPSELYAQSFCEILPPHRKCGQVPSETLCLHLLFEEHAVAPGYNPLRLHVKSVPLGNAANNLGSPHHVVSSPGP
ncbi:unnamed protein product [Protopolystoma xenopodis]|uniref:Uncharacterized protein n=1 Tax=Protopolystoma xenopodis TaxID=117903 RepID=A0A3S5A884_9PLAT|nr:unnamed protein product [Protopolystoma xenopodis]